MPVSVICLASSTRPISRSNCVVPRTASSRADQIHACVYVACSPTKMVLSSVRKYAGRYQACWPAPSPARNSSRAQIFRAQEPVYSVAAMSPCTSTVARCTRATCSASVEHGAVRDEGSEGEWETGETLIDRSPCRSTEIDGFVVEGVAVVGESASLVCDVV